MSQPALVSIILTAQIPTWFIAALDSVLAQDYANCEILIADSGGDKYIPELLATRLDNPAHPIRHLVYGKDDKGIYEAAIREAKGQYLKFVTDAELLAEDCVSAMVAGLQRYPQCRVASSRRKRIDPHGELLPDIVATSPLLDYDAILNGRDLLRCQSRLSYSLLGELTASLFYLEDIVALLPEQGSLFAIEDQKLLEVEGLLVYSKLLGQSDVLWFPQALCSIRASEVYKQPHQRDSVEHVKKNRDIILNTLRAAPWFNDSGSPVNMVQVTALDDRHKTEAKNLVSHQFHYLNLNTLAWWNRVRTLQPFQQQRLEQLAAEQSEPTRVAVVINVTAENRDGLTQTLDSLIHQSAGNLRLIPVVTGLMDSIPEKIAAYPATEESRLATLNQLIAQRDEHWFIFIEAGSYFMSAGLIALSTTLAQADGVLAIFADEYFYLGDEPSGINFRPDFNLDLLLSSPKTMAQHWLFRRELLQAAEGFDLSYPQAAEFDLIVKMIESQGLNVAGHLAEPLLTARLQKRGIIEDAAIIERHLNNRGYPQAQIALDSYYNYRLRYQHAVQPKVTIVVLANWHLPSLIGCVTTLLEKTRYLNYELLIVADSQGSQERDGWLTSMASVDPLRIRVLHYSEPYQHGAMANLAAEQAQGEYLVFMHCELAVTDGEWLDNLLNHGQRPEVAVVGGKQLTSDNKIRHAGYILGMNGAAGEAFRGLEDNQPSYQGRLHLDQNYSAVSGDFMLVRREVFSALGGFTGENQLYGDVDFCLRARNEGYMTVWTPYARILRPAARQNPFPGETVHSSNKLKQLEEDKLFSRWMPLIANDPAFNANLSLRSRHFDLNSDSLLSWRPAQRENLPVFLAHNADISGCGHYRIMQPFEAMQREGLAEGKASLTLLNIGEIGQFRPDSLIIQRRYAPAFHNWIERTGKLHDVFKVFELDDYILNVPMKHYRRSSFKQETTGQMRKSLSYFDRFVVSTAPLAEAMSDMHSNIVVVKNRLPVSIWGQLQSRRNQGRKPRVGWAGGSSHRGDLEMIADVVKEFTHEVEWVFMGLCPPKLQPYVHEIHYGVDISLYPATMAALNLDLALAPVEDNIFNACKSNLRLLEYGACGIPVICSNVACYCDDDLPVTRVSNRFIDWRDAIRMHLADPDASAKMGEALQAAVRRDWMLTGENVKEWVRAWSAD
ncbi:O-antigen biosynthesis protein [Erwinia typographi]|uniref:O-antigen biosynthesis protein n=1 Tax=Erwinia typographi TaxID=371042 RepID=A0A0A4ADU7_9GAMM|nr:glycosyltransferase [Erwinia typographi]KGT96003.1 O-antigen biosynthesis protein [Erwinia typographi]